MAEYNAARIRIFGESRSSNRARKYWNEIKLKKNNTISSLTTLHSDVRPYANISLLNRSFGGLLDSGATSSCVGNKLAIEIANCENMMKKLNCNLRTAEGRRQRVMGMVKLDVTFNGVTKMVEFYVVPAFDQDVILGWNFWVTFGLDKRLGIINEISLLSPDAHELNVTQRQVLDSAIRAFPSFEGKGLGRTTLVEHTIDVGGAKPIKQRHFPISPAIEKLVGEEIDRMLQMGVIEESSSSWSSPVVLVKKPGKVRLCLDSRKVNAVTVRDAYPLPHIEGILSRLPRAEFISSLDLKDAFWQIPLDMNSRDKTAFTVPNRPLYQFTVMPFGLCNAPQTMCRLMDKVIPYNLRERVFVYLDDLLLISEDFSSHIDLLYEVAHHIRKAGLTINIGKSHFCLRHVKYLGYVVGNGTLQTDPDKVSAVVDFPSPKSVRELRRFLGMTGWYRRFIANFAEISNPLTELLKKSKTFSWTDEAQRAFVNLKSRLTTAPVLINPDFTKPFIINCDASQYGVGAVLAQKSEDGCEVPVAFMSQKLNAAQRNYSVTEQECLAAVLAVKKFRPYVEGQDFTIITDHASLRWLMSQTDLSGRLARWALKLQSFVFKIEHRKGSANVVPDALSRAEYAEISVINTGFESGPDIDLNSSEFDSEVYVKWRKQLESNSSKYPDFRVVGKFIYHRTEFYNGNSDDEDSAWKLFVPENLRLSVISNAHDLPVSAHSGISKTIEKVRRLFYWPGLYRSVRTYVSNCSICKETKHPTKVLRPPMGKYIPVERIFQRLFVDLVGPFPRSKNGNIGILVVLDQVSRFTFLYPVRKFTSKIIVDYLRNHIFNVFGVPEFLTSDNGSQFKSAEFVQFLSQYGVKHLCTAVYSPQSNACERVNRSVNAALRAYIKNDQREWDCHLSSINAALRSTVHQSTGQSPYFVVFGQHMVTHGDNYELLRNLDIVEEGHILNDESRHDNLSKIREIVRKNLEKSHNENSKRYNLRSREIEYSVGEEVLKRNFVQSKASENFNAKLAKTFVRARVRRKIGNSYYELQDDKCKILGVFHAKDLQPIKVK